MPGATRNIKRNIMHVPNHRELNTRKQLKIAHACVHPFALEFKSYFPIETTTENGKISRSLRKLI